MLVQLIKMESEEMFDLTLTTTDRAICPGSKGPFVPVLEPGFGCRDKSLGVIEPGQNVPHAKFFLRPAGFEPKTYCLAHGFLANSPK